MLNTDVLPSCCLSEMISEYLDIITAPEAWWRTIAAYVQI